MTLTEAKLDAAMQAALTGEAWAVCDNVEGELFTVPANTYLDSQIFVAQPPAVLAKERP